MVNVTEDVTGLHGPLVVSVNVTVPLLPAIGVKFTSEGVATAPVLLYWLDALVMLPVTPVIVHVPEVALPPILEPAKLYAAPVHIELFEPALELASAFTDKIEAEVFTAPLIFVNTAR